VVKVKTMARMMAADAVYEIDRVGCFTPSRH
jgi:hypothetical protein